MATIKAGTVVTWNGTVRFEDSTDDFLPAINNLSIYFTSNNTAFSSFGCRCDVDNGVGYFYYLPSSPFVEALTPYDWGSSDSGYFMDFLPATEYETFTVTQDVELTDEQYAEIASNSTIVAPVSTLKYIHLYREDNLPYKIYQAETDADMDILKNDEEADGCVVEFVGTSASGAYEQGRFYICERDIALPTFIIYASDYYHDCEYEGKEYQYEEGMTWGEWLTSDYNVDGWEDDGQSYVTPHPGTYYVVRNTSSVWVTLSDIISDDQYWCYEM